VNIASNHTIGKKDMQNKIHVDVGPITCPVNVLKNSVFLFNSVLQLLLRSEADNKSYGISQCNKFRRCR